MTTQTIEPTGVGFDRPPEPYNREAEQVVLGAMMLSADTVDPVTAVLKAADFYEPRHITIFKVILDLHARGEPTSALAVATRLAEDGLLGRIDGAPYLHTLTAAVPTVANAGYYAAIVRNHADDRRYIALGMQIQQIGYSPNHDPDHPKAARISQLVTDLTSGADRSDLKPASEFIGEVLDSIEAGPQQGLSTGLIDLDLLTNGLTPGLVVIGARPSIGKSTLLVDFVRSVALRQGLPVALFTLEMSRDEVLKRILSAEARVPHHRITLGGKHLDENDWVRLHEAAARIADAPLFIDDATGVSLADISTRSRRLAARHPLGLIGIDYLQLMDSGAGRETRQQEVAAISRGLKILSGDLHVPVALVSQLNRGPEQRADKRPQLADLRDSGGVEQDADLAILLHRPDFYDKECPRAGEVDLIVAKNRHGPTDTITAAAQLHLCRIADIAIPAMTTPLGG